MLFKIEIGLIEKKTSNNVVPPETAGFPAGLVG